MKKFIIFLFLIVFCVQFGFSQKWVSTSPQKKMVVLEEFTGIHCGYCPDGHRRANDLVTENPGKIILINIHSGNFATPQTGEPDFRTIKGDSIDDAAGVTGYPSGSVNRTTSPWGQSRTTWATAASTIMSQTSPVNVAVKAFVDHVTRELTVEVEAYYTSNSNASKNYLTVMLLQNGVLGPQSDYGNYNPTNWINGKYVHNHVLRDVLSANFGDVIDTTTSGYYFYKKYTYTLPSSIVNVDLLFHRLKVVAFVAESKANILSGAETNVDFDANLKADLAMIDITEIPTNMCFTTINPKIKVKNNMATTITDFEVIAKVGTTEYKKTFSGSLAQNDSTTIDWGVINFTASGSFAIQISGFNNVNGGGIYDIELMNDFASISGIGFKSDAFSQFTGSFENSTPANFAMDQSENKAFSLAYSTTTPYGALSSKGAIRFALHESWEVAGKPGKILFGEADLTKLTDPYLSFHYAYSDDNYGGTKPLIKIEVSENCGDSWQEVHTVTCVETGVPATHGNWYVPKSTEYIWVGLPLTDYKDKSVLFRLSVIPGSAGNALYIDEIKLGETSGIEETVANVPFKIYPNPVNEFMVIDLDNPSETPVRIAVINTLGKVVYTSEMSSQNLVKVNTSNFEKGLYIINMTIGDQAYSQKFLVE